MIRAAIDTNVLVSGLLSSAGNEALVILALHHGLIKPCLSDAIIREYISVLARPKFAFGRDEINALLAMLTTKGEFFTPENFLVASPDPADTKFLHCALGAQADFIVTGNKRDFPATPYGVTHVVNAGELLDRITTGL